MMASISQQHKEIYTQISHPWGPARYKKIEGSGENNTHSEQRAPPLLSCSSFILIFGPLQYWLLAALGDVLRGMTERNKYNTN